MNHAFVAASRESAAIPHNPILRRSDETPRHRPLALCASLAFLAGAIHPAQAQFFGQKTYCNPVDINYQYNFEQKARNISYRSGADPVIVNHNGEYYMFVTISGGWWHSKDLLHWQYVKPNIWPKEDMCA